MTQKYLNSSYDKEDDSTQVLLIGVIKAYLSHYKGTIRFYEMHFCTKFYNHFILKISPCTIMLGFCKSGHICEMPPYVATLSYNMYSIEFL